MGIPPSLGFWGSLPVSQNWRSLFDELKHLQPKSSSPQLNLPWLAMTRMTKDLHRDVHQADQFSFSLFISILLVPLFPWLQAGLFDDCKQTCRKQHLTLMLFSDFLPFYMFSVLQHWFLHIRVMNALMTSVNSHICVVFKMVLRIFFYVTDGWITANLPVVMSACCFCGSELQHVPAQSEGVTKLL